MLRMVSLAVVGCLTFLTGCTNSGPAAYPVTGTVTFDGQPVQVGDITFESESGDVSTDAGKIVNGKYACEVKPGVAAKWWAI